MSDAEKSVDQIRSSGRIVFVSLMYLQSSTQDFENTGLRDVERMHWQYLRNAAGLTASLKRSGFAHSILTNDRDRLIRAARGAQLDPEMLCIEQMEFAISFPNELRFNSAHRKIEVFRYLSTQKSSNFYVLCDLDMYAVNMAPESFNRLVGGNQVIAYDISDQVIPAYSEARIMLDFKKAFGLDLPPRWYGGELIGAHPQAFGLLFEHCIAGLPSYLDAAPELHHQGDEMLTSMALARMRESGVDIADAGKLLYVARHWSSRTKHPKAAVRMIKSNFLIHLPNGKDFLAELGLLPSAVSGEKFWTKYTWYNIGRAIRSPIRILRYLKRQA